MKRFAFILRGMFFAGTVVFITPVAFATTAPQAIEGFSSIVYASRSAASATYRGINTTSYYENAGTAEYVEFYTADVPSAYTTGKVTFLWSGLTGSEAGGHSLYLNGKNLLTFTSNNLQDRSWASGNYELYFDYKSTITTKVLWSTRKYGSGVYYLTVPASDVIPGQKNKIKLLSGSNGGTYDHAMAFNFTDTLAYETSRGTLDSNHIGRSEEAPKIPPKINSFTASPTSGNAPLDVRFTCSAQDTDGTILNYTWNFGDGNTNTTTANQINHTYSNPNTYSATVGVKDNDNLTQISTPLTITITQAPVPKIPPKINSFAASPTSGQSPLSVNFTCSAQDTDGTIVNYAWTFGDGNTNTTTTNQITHTYNNANTYSATVGVKDNNNLTQVSTSLNITVTQAPVPPPPPPQEPSIPQVMRFQGRLTDKDAKPVSGTHSITFSLYDTEIQGTALWTETQANVAIDSGIIDVLLGSVTPIDLAFDKQYWLGIKIDNDEEMSPRIMLTSVPYSFRAKK